MEIIIVDKEELEAYLLSRFGSKLQTGKRQRNIADEYTWDKKAKFLHNNPEAKGAMV